MCVNVAIEYITSVIGHCLGSCHVIPGGGVPRSNRYHDDGDPMVMSPIVHCTCVIFMHDIEI